MVSKNGYPLAYDVFAGNKFEGHTILPMIDSFKEKYKLQQLVVIADSGLLSSQNIAELQQKQYGFILGARIKNENKQIKQKILALKLKNGESEIERNQILDLLPKLGEAYRLKILFDDFWQMKDDDAQSFLTFWCDYAIEAKLQPFINFVKTVKNHWEGIMNYTKFKLTNGILEGTNSKIQLTKKRARGYRNKTNFINIIYLSAGKLKFD